MTENIEVFKQNSIRINAREGILYADPFQIEGAPHDADFVFITHDHYDHFSVEDILKVSKADTVLVMPRKMEKKAAELKETMKTVCLVLPGERIDEYSVVFETVPSYNIMKPFHPKGAGWVGYIFEVNDTRIYVAGDTDGTNEAKKVQCDIALVPIGGTYTMNAKEAAALINEMRPKVAIPTHYGSIVGSMKDADVFSEGVDHQIKVEVKIK